MTTLAISAPVSNERKQESYPALKRVQEMIEHTRNAVMAVLNNVVVPAGKTVAVIVVPVGKVAVDIAGAAARVGTYGLVTLGKSVILGAMSAIFSRKK